VRFVAALAAGVGRAKRWAVDSDGGLSLLASTLSSLRCAVWPALRRLPFRCLH